VLSRSDKVSVTLNTSNIYKKLILFGNQQTNGLRSSSGVKYQFTDLLWDKSSSTAINCLESALRSQSNDFNNTGVGEEHFSGLNIRRKKALRRKEQWLKSG
jgi:hypothetical protein